MAPGTITADCPKNLNLASWHFYLAVVNKEFELAKEKHDFIRDWKDD